MSEKSERCKRGDRVCVCFNARLRGCLCATRTPPLRCRSHGGSDSLSSRRACKPDQQSVGPQARSSAWHASRSRAACCGRLLPDRAQIIVSRTPAETSLDVAYAVRLEPAFTGGYFVSCRDLPDLLVHGDDREDALRRASEAVDLLLAVLLDDDSAPPFPTAMRPQEVMVYPSETTQQLLRYYFAPDRAPGAQ